MSEASRSGGDLWSDEPSPAEDIAQDASRTRLWPAFLPLRWAEDWTIGATWVPKSSTPRITSAWETAPMLLLAR